MNTALICGLIILVVLVVLLVAGVPIAVALGISSVCAILPIMDTGVAVLTGAQRIFSGISVFSLLAIPFFILAGNLMNKGGIAVRLINLAKVVTGRTPGALAQTNVLANMLFGAISGSGTAAASAMGSIIGPIEKEEGYDPNFSAAANVATAPTGLLIPPSNVMITFSLVSGGTSVAALFMAGYIPGILWGLACMIVIFCIAKKRGYRSSTTFTAKEKWNIFLQALPCLLLIIIVIVLCSLLVLPGIFRFQMFNVISGSMEPTVRVGSLIYVHEEKPEEIGEKDIIAFYGMPDGGIITHRVVKNNVVSGTFITKGDANDGEDPTPVPYDHFIGKVTLTVPYMGRVLTIMTSFHGKIAAACVVGLGAVLNLIGGRKRSPCSRLPLCAPCRLPLFMKRPPE